MSIIKQVKAIKGRITEAVLSAQDDGRISGIVSIDPKSVDLDKPNLWVADVEAKTEDDLNALSGFVSKFSTSINIVESSVTSIKRTGGCHAKLSVEMKINSSVLEKAEEELRTFAKELACKLFLDEDESPKKVRIVADLYASGGTEVIDFEALPGDNLGSIPISKLVDAVRGYMESNGYAHWESYVSSNNRKLTINMRLYPNWRTSRI